MNEDDLYDEFGNFIGDANDSDAESDTSMSFQRNQQEAVGEYNSSDGEDAHHHSSHQENGGSSSKALIEADKDVPMEEPEVIYVNPTDEGSKEPVIKPIEDKTLFIEYKSTTQQDLPETVYSKEYFLDVMKNFPGRVRNVAVVGGLHSGKTSFIDALVHQTHPGIAASEYHTKDFKPMRYLDTHKLARDRGVSLSLSPISLLLQDSKDRSHVVNLIDTPGHPDFSDDLCSSLQAVEGAVVVIDILEGLTAPSKNIITEVMKRNLPMVVVLNKFDRLILELQLPPTDCYQKIRYVLDDINAFIYYNEYVSGYTGELLISPLKDNVIFSSNVLSATFTIGSWCEIYENSFPSMDKSKLKQLLWGDVFFEKSKFTGSPSGSTVPTTFEQFILQPLYKLLTHTIVADSKETELTSILWDQFKIRLHKSVYKGDPQTLLRNVFSALFKDSRYFVSSLVSNISPPNSANSLQSKGCSTELVAQDGFVGEVLKLTPGSSRSTFNCITRVYKGTARVGSKVLIPGIQFEADKSSRLEVIESISVPVGRYSMNVEEAPEGMIVILTGICASIEKSSSLFSAGHKKDSITQIHRRSNGEKSVFKVAVECENPSELPKLISALNTLNKTYTSAVIKLEESGERVILAPGELYMDCFLHDLRHYDKDYLSIKVSDPMVKFSESCAERSATKISTYSPSKKDKISITAEPVNDKRLSKAIEQGSLSLSNPVKTTAKMLQNEYDWDALAARSIWCFGPSDMQSPTMLLDDTLSSETDKAALLNLKDSIVNGFKLGINEGPLCDEPIRNTKFKILDAVLQGSSVSGGSQIIPMTRRAVHSGLLTAVPKLLEPTYKVYVTCTYRSVQAVHTILEKRRGWAVAEVPIAATQLYEIEGFVPVIDSVGLDTEMRLYTQGQAFCLTEFAKWTTVPGDPLDKDCPLPQLKPVPRSSLARDFMMKTRRRKGLSGEPNLKKYIDPDLYLKLTESGIIA